MKVVPRLILGMEFSSSADRDAWVIKLQSVWTTLKATMPIPTKVIMTPDEYIVQERLPDIILG